jgi:hypothetical protein
MLAFAVIVMLLLPFFNNPLLIVVILPVVIVAVVRVPTDVMLGCAAVVTVPAVVAAETVPDTLPPVTELALAATVALDARPVNAPVNVVADTLPALMLPVTASEVNVPTDVMLGCAAVVTVPAVFAAETVPDTFAPATELALAATVALDARPVNAPVNVVALTLPALMLPVTANEVNVPTDVMFP